MSLLQLSIDGDSVQTVAVMENEFCPFIKMKFLLSSKIETESKENTIQGVIQTVYFKIF